MPAGLPELHGQFQLAPEQLHVIFDDGVWDLFFLAGASYFETVLDLPA